MYTNLRFCLSLFPRQSCILTHGCNAFSAAFTADSCAYLPGAPHAGQLYAVELVHVNKRRRSLLSHSPDLRITGGVVLRSASMVHRRHDKVSVWPSALIATLCVQKPASTGYAMVMQVSKWPVRHTTQHVPPHNHSHTIHIAFNNSVIAMGDARGWCIIG